MHRVDTSTAVAGLPAPDAAGAPGYFTKGNPAADPPVPATVPGQDWFNMIQEEIAAVIEGMGLTLDATKADFTQLRQAIQQMIIAGGKTVKVTEAVFEGTVADGDAVRWDAGGGEYVKALADGTAANRAVGVADVTNAEVIFFGVTRADLFAGLTPGARYYLSGAAAGEMVDTAPEDPVRFGIALSATQFFVDVDTGEAPTVTDTAGETFTVVAGGPTLTLDGDAGPNYDVTLDQAMTVAFANVGAANTVYSFYVRFKQDATGGWPLNLPAGSGWSYGEVPPISTDPNVMHKIAIETWDGGASGEVAYVGGEYA